MGIFSYDSKLTHTLNQIFDFLVLNLLWAVSCLPVITVGAATTALYHTVDKVLRRGEGKLWKEYWRVFRRDWKRATALWAIMLLAFAVMAANWFVASDLESLSSGVRSFMQILSIFLVVFMAIWMQLWFPYLSRFDDPVKRILKNTMAMVMAETGVAFRLLVLIVFVVIMDVLFSRYVPVMGLLLPVAYMTSLNRILEKLFARYISKQELSTGTDS